MTEQGQVQANGFAVCLHEPYLQAAHDWHYIVKKTFVELPEESLEPPPKLRRGSSEPRKLVGAGASSDVALVGGADQIISDHADITNKMKAMLQDTRMLNYPAPNIVLAEGSVLYLPRPPHDFHGVEDGDVEVLNDPDRFENRLKEMEAQVPPGACRAPVKPSRDNRPLNERQRERKEKTGAKDGAAMSLHHKFFLWHVPIDLLRPDLRDLRKNLRDLVLNKAPNWIEKEKDQRQKPALAYCVVSQVLDEVSHFLVKFHNHPEGQLDDLKERVKRPEDAAELAEIIVEWAGFKEAQGAKVFDTLPRELQDRSELGAIFRKIFLAIVEPGPGQPQFYPERRMHLRRSRHNIFTWKVSVPPCIEGKYLGDFQTVTKMLRSSGNTEVKVDPEHCIDAQRYWRFTTLLFQSEHNSWDCSPGPISQFPKNGSVYVLCKICQGVKIGDPCTGCNCMTWLSSLFANSELPAGEEAKKWMQRTSLPMDEMHCKKHLADYVVGRPQDKNSDEEGALNMRQFTHGKANVIALAFTGAS